MTGIKKIMLFAVIVALIIGIGIAVFLPKSQVDTKKIESLDDLKGAKIAVRTGTIFGAVAEENVENAELYYTINESDSIAMLDTGKVKGWTTDEPVARYVLNEYTNFRILTRMINDSYAYVFNKDSEKSQKLCEQMNEYLAKIKSDGTLEKIDAAWFGEDESVKVVDIPTEGEAVILATSSSTGAPFAYMKDGNLVGYDIDIAARFCAEYGYSLEINDYDFNGMLSAVQTGKGADFGSSCISITEERKEKMLFSAPNYEGGVVMVVNDGDASESNINSIDELNGEKIVVLTGGVFDKITEENVDNPRFYYSNAEADSALMLNSGKVRGWATDEPLARNAIKQYPNFRVLQQMTTNGYAFAFNKDSEESRKLCAQVNEYLAKIKSDGTLEKIDAVWFGDDEAVMTVDYPTEGKNGHIVFATSSIVGAPFAYVKNGEYVGYDIDIVAHFCLEYGYSLEIKDYDFTAMLSAIQSGKEVDFGGACIVVNEERKEKMLFSDPDYEGGVVMVVNDADSSAESGGFSAFIYEQVNNFKGTFIKENRWMLFLKGVGNTMLITVLAVILGTIFGFVLFWVSRNTGKGFNGIISLFTKLIEGMPVVVLLMVLYYIIFGKSDISNISVAVIGFTVIFGSGVLNMLTRSADTVSHAQTEASLALGFTKTQTFFKVIMPQAIRHFLPAFKSEVIALLKATAIVGYLAVQDLTKMSDVVRASTYDAFFPLIAAAVIYFILEFILISIVNSIRIGTDYKRRSAQKILKGIKIK